MRARSIRGKVVLRVKTSLRRVWLILSLTILSGILLHFLYDWLPSPLTAVFSPVRESLWEHVKIIYWPFLAAMWLLTRGGERGGQAPWLLSLLLICGGMLAVAYWYHFVRGGESLAFDIGLYFVSIAAGFLLARLFRGLDGRGWWREGLWVLVLLLGGAILLFTFLTPTGALFADLAAVRTWLTIPF